MRKTPYPLELLETVTSLFSLNIPLFASRTVNPIEESAKQSYVFKTYLKGDDITMQYKGGVVTLTGIVADESHKLLARETVASLPGVTSVQAKLKVQGEVPSVNTDERLMTKVKLTLLFHQNVNAAETEVIAKNGTIILRGKAASTTQKDLTTEYAKDVEGVKKVENEMKVVFAALKPDEIKKRQELDTTESIDDASVTALVKTTLLYHHSTSTLGITVETRDGVVKLDGKAGSWEEKNLVAKRVIDVPGVKMVFNNMTIERIASMTN